MARARQMQTFEATRLQVIECCIDVLQDLGFVVWDTDMEIGLIVGRGGQAESALSVKVEDWGKDETRVRLATTPQAVQWVSGTEELSDIEEGDFYRDFFLLLRRALYLRSEGL